VLTYVQQSSPLSTPADLTDRRPIRLVGSLFWSRGPYEAGWTARYIEGYFFTSTQNAASAIEHDLQVSCELGQLPVVRQADNRWLRRAVQDTRLTATVMNVLDRQPPFVLTTRGFTSTDPRMARYVVSLSKKL